MSSLMVFSRVGAGYVHYRRGRRKAKVGRAGDGGPNILISPDTEMTWLNLWCDRKGSAGVIEKFYGCRSDAASRIDQNNFRAIASAVRDLWEDKRRGRSAFSVGHRKSRQ